MAIPASEFPDRVQALRLEGVPTFVAASQRTSIRASLVFRVGVTDECLSRRGITHLVEHLALSALGEKPYQYNGSVDGLYARFYMTGRPDEVVEFFGHVTTALNDLPLDRLAREAEVLRIEAAGRSVRWLSALLNFRYGWSGWGLLGSEEFGLRKPDPDEVQRWARTHFVAENAAMWIHGPVPSGLRLGLPAGARSEVRPSKPALTTYPAWVAQDVPGAGLSMVGRRSAALNAIAYVAQRRAHAELREEAASYSVQPSYERLGKDLAHVAFWADALPAGVDRVTNGLLGVMNGLAQSGPRPDELQQYLREVERVDDEPDSIVLELDSAATAELTGSVPFRHEVWHDEIRAVTPALAREAAAEALHTALALVPPSVMPLPGFIPIPQWSDERATGVAVGLRLGMSNVGRNIRLTLSETGATLAFDRSRLVTVWFDRCAAMLTWNDGSRTLYGNDGFRLHLCPRDWKNGGSVMRWIDRHVPADRLVVMGDRPSPDPEALVHEPLYKFPTDYLAALVAGLWCALAMGILLSVGSGGPSGALVTVMLLFLVALRPTIILYQRLRAPRVRRV